MRSALVVASALSVFSLAAHADSFIYSGSVIYDDPAFPAGNFVTSAALVASSQETVSASGSIEGGHVLYAVALNQTSNGNIHVINGGFELFATDGSLLPGRIAFTPAQYTTPGTYTGYYAPNGEYDTLTVTQVQVTPSNPVSVTPEPSGFALLGTGLLGMVGVLRKRFA